MNTQNYDRISSTASRILFYITLISYFIANTAKYSSLRYSVSNYTVLPKRLLWVCCGVAIFNILFLCRYHWRHLIFVLLLLGLTGYIYYNTKYQDYLPIQSTAILFSGRHANWKTIVKLSFAAWFLITSITFALNCLGVTPTLETYRNGRLRYNLGFAHPNGVGLYLLCFVFLWILLRYEKLKFYEYLIWILLAAFAWIYPNSRTGTFSLLLLCFVTLFFKICGNALLESGIFRWLCIFSFPLMGAFSYFASYFYKASDALYVKIDNIGFTGRLSLANYMQQLYSILPFGQKLKLIGSVRAAQKGIPAQILDNFYVRVLLNDGAVLFIIFLAVMMFLTYKAIQRRDFGTLIVILISSVYCIYEFHHTELMYNICLLQTVFLLFDPVSPLVPEGQDSGRGRHRQHRRQHRHRIRENETDID